MNTKTQRYGAAGLDESGSLGRYLMDHHLGVGASGIFEGELDKTTFGRRPNGVYVPRYRNLHEEGKGYIRGFGYQGGAAGRQGWSRDILGFGEEFKKQYTSLGPWSVNLGGFGEWLPYKDNMMTLSPDKKDQWGLPQLVIDAGYTSNELNMRKDMEADAAEMLEAMGAKNVSSRTSEPAFSFGYPRNGYCPDGYRPQKLGAEQVEPGLGGTQRICYGWRVHDFSQLCESFLDLWP